MTTSLKVSVGNLKDRMQLTGAAQSSYSVPWAMLKREVEITWKCIIT